MRPSTRRKRRADYRLRRKRGVNAPKAPCRHFSPIFAHETPARDLSDRRAPTLDPTLHPRGRQGTIITIAHTTTRRCARHRLQLSDAVAYDAYISPNANKMRVRQMKADQVKLSKHNVEQMARGYFSNCKRF